MDVPGRFLLVDHSIVRAMEKGALGGLEVAGVTQPSPPQRGRGSSPGRGFAHLSNISLMDGGKVVVYDTATFDVIAQFPAERPSGIFFADRAHRFGM